MEFSKKAIVKYIKQRQQKDGGFHFANVEPSGGADTFYAVSTISMLDESVEKRDLVKNFFDKLMSEEEARDVVGIYFTISTLYKLGYEKNDLRKYFDMEEVSRSSMPKNKEDVFVETVSSLKNTYYATNITELLGINVDTHKITDFVRSFKHKNGGYASRGYPSIPDTFFALSTLHNINELNEETATRKYLLNVSHSILSSYLEYLYWHFESLLLLNETPAYKDMIPGYLARCARTDGGFCRSPFQGISTFEDTFYAVKILTRLEQIINKKLLI